MKIIDKIADWLDRFEEFKNRLAQRYLLEKTQIALLAVMFFIIIFMVCYKLYQAGISLYFFLILITLILIGVLIMFGQLERKKRRVSKIQKESSLKIELQNFDFKIPQNKLKKLHYNLCRHNILDENVVKESVFINVWLLNFKAHEDVIILDIDYAQSKYLIEKFIKVDALVKENGFYKMKTLTLTDLCSSNKFVKNGKPLTQKQLTSNYSDAKKNNPTKLLEFETLINEIFTLSLDI